MIKHIVLLKFKDGIDKNAIKNTFALLQGLQTTIPQIKSFKYGQYESKEGLNHGFEYGFEIEFATAEDRDIYLYHPDHVVVAGKIIPLLQDGTNSLIAFDYDTEKAL